MLFSVFVGLLVVVVVVVAAESNRNLTTDFRFEIKINFTTKYLQ